MTPRLLRVGLVLGALLVADVARGQDILVPTVVPGSYVMSPWSGGGMVTVRTRGYAVPVVDRAVVPTTVLVPTTTVVRSAPLPVLTETRVVTPAPIVTMAPVVPTTTVVSAPALVPTTVVIQRRPLLPMPLFPGRTVVRTYTPIW